MTTATLGFIIFTVIGLQIIVMGWFAIRRQKHKRNDFEIRHNEAPIAPPTENHKSAVATDVTADCWAGFREFIVERQVFEDKNRSICSFYLVPVDEQPLPTFSPGQYLTFNLSIADPTTHNLKSVVRCYSLSNGLGDASYRVSIKRALPPSNSPELPPGISSNFFHDHVKVGSRLLVKAPSGNFKLIKDEPLPIVLIGGGIGITPMLSILNTIAESGSKRDVWLFYGVRNGNEHIMKEHLQMLAAEHNNFHLHVCYSAPNESDVTGSDYHHNGRIDLPLLRATLKLMRYQFYVCGPQAMMTSLIPGLEEWGVEKRDIYYESFGPATFLKQTKTKINAKASSASAAPITITFSKSGKTIDWDPEFASLLEFAEANSIDAESGCRAGSCGCCQTKLTSGAVKYTQQPDVGLEPGHCLLCISTPSGNLTLEA